MVGEDFVGTSVPSRSRASQGASRGLPKAFEGVSQVQALPHKPCVEHSTAPTYPNRGATSGGIRASGLRQGLELFCLNQPQDLHLLGPKAPLRYCTPDMPQ